MNHVHPASSFRLSLAVAVAVAVLAWSLPGQDPARPQEPVRRSSIPAPSAPGGQTPVGPPRLPDGISREQMWPAPTEADWKKPCLVTFQRTWDDALAVARQSRKPILVCINMDGEIASEHHAGIRYRQPETAALYQPYVCVIASVYRHTPRDFDDQGQRILCPRFGSVTCGEHIAIEPILFEKFMDGRRIAPRHICVEPDQDLAETFDVFYTWDTASVFQTLRAGAADRPPPTPPPAGDRTLAQRALSHDIADRMFVELAYLNGTVEARRRLLEGALAHRELDQVDLLRLALFGLDPDLALLARRALAQCESESAIDLIAEALRVPMAAEERETLINALERLGRTWPRARTLVAVHRGLAARSTALDAEGWARALDAAAASRPAPSAAPDRSTLHNQLSYQAQAAERNPKDHRARVALAESYLALALDAGTSPRFGRVMLEDARRVAAEARTLGADGWRVHAVLALLAARAGDMPEAWARAESAVAALPENPQDAWSARVLALFAEGRQMAIWQAMREKRGWPAQWLTDVNATYSVLGRHPHGTDEHCAAHVDFLESVRAQGQATEVLEAGLLRFPDSWALHDRLRTRVVSEKGATALAAVYEARLARPGASPNEAWFAGYAAIVTAEFQRRARKPDLALVAYQRALDLYGRAAAANPQSQDSCDHYAALALAGRGRIQLEAGDLDAAVASILLSLQRRAASAASLDGLNLSPVDTAKMLRSRLGDAKRTEMVTQLQAALDALDPQLLELPAYERELPPEGAQSRPQRRGRRR